MEFLNYFMHPSNCSALINSVSSTGWNEFLLTTNLEDIADPLKSLIIEIFQNYQAFTPFSQYSRESYAQYVISSLPEDKLSFSSKKMDDCVSVCACLSDSQFKELGLSIDKHKSYKIFIEFIIDYSFEALTNKALLEIQKNSLGKSFVKLFKKYLSR